MLLISSPQPSWVAPLPKHPLFPGDHVPQRLPPQARREPWRTRAPRLPAVLPARGSPPRQGDPASPRDDGLAQGPVEGSPPGPPGQGNGPLKSSQAPTTAMLARRASCPARSRPPGVYWAPVTHGDSAGTGATRICPAVWALAEACPSREMSTLLTPRRGRLLPSCCSRPALASRPRARCGFGLPERARDSGELYRTFLPLDTWLLTCSRFEGGFMDFLGPQGLQPTGWVTPWASAV